jgi:hypothetical protein
VWGDAFAGGAKKIKDRIAVVKNDAAKGTWWVGGMPRRLKTHHVWARPPVGHSRMNGRAPIFGQTWIQERTSTRSIINHQQIETSTSSIVRAFTTPSLVVAQSRPSRN